MARQRRGGGFKPPELRGTLGTLLRTAAAQVGPLRDALERTAREGRSRLSDARQSRRRSDALAELGEIVLDLIRQGEIDVAELPEVRDIVAHLDDLDAGLDAAHHDSEDDERFAAPPVRNRFDSRRGPGRNSSDDGTVSSSQTWAPPSRSAGAKPAARVWRPPVDDDAKAPTDPDSTPSSSAARPAAPTPTRRMVPLPKDPTRKGGISFDDDDDLADYMHPDDVPAKKPPDGDA